jgi:Sulfotransferase family
MGSAPVKVVYIAGLGRSGSTLLGALLGQLDGFFYAGELVHADRAFAEGSLCGCGVPVADCFTWRAVLAAAFPAGDPDLSLLGIDFTETQVRGMLRQRLRRKRLWPAAPDLDRRRTAFAAVLQAIVATTGARVVVDSSKSPGFGYFVQTAEAVDLYVVHLVRDPRAVAHSRLRTGDRRGKMLLPPPPGFAVVWDIWNTAIELAWRGGRYLRLRYEDVVHSPEVAVARVAVLTGERAGGLRRVDADRVVLAPTHSLSGNRSRLRTGEIQLRLDDEWKTARGRGLSAAQQGAVTALTWPWRVRYGYGRAD